MREGRVSCVMSGGEVAGVENSTEKGGDEEMEDDTWLGTWNRMGAETEDEVDTDDNGDETSERATA